jgi:hypothetical protein
MEIIIKNKEGENMKKITKNTTIELTKEVIKNSFGLFQLTSMIDSLTTKIYDLELELSDLKAKIEIMEK